MNTHAGKNHGKKSFSVANAAAQKKRNVDSAFAFADNRPEAAAQRKMLEMANHNAQSMLMGTIPRIPASRLGDTQSTQMQVMDKSHFEPQNPIQKKSNVIQRADYYAYGAANTTPHIHVYNNVNCHIKVAGGHRFNLVQNGRRVRQTAINVAFDQVRADYPDPNNPARKALLAIMANLIKNVRKHEEDE